MSTLLRFARSRAYSSRISCSRGVQVGLVVDGGAGSAIEPVRQGIRADRRGGLVPWSSLMDGHTSQIIQSTCRRSKLE